MEEKWGNPESCHRNRAQSFKFSNSLSKISTLSPFSPIGKKGHTGLGGASNKSKSTRSQSPLSFSFTKDFCSINQCTRSFLPRDQSHTHVRPEQASPPCFFSVHISVRNHFYFSSFKPPRLLQLLHQRHIFRLGIRWRETFIKNILPRIEFVCGLMFTIPHFLRYVDGDGSKR